MFGLDKLETLFVVWGFFFQVVLIVHFSLRKWAFYTYTRKWGWIVYAMSIPAAAVSLILLVGHKPWALWLGGFIYLVWAFFGYWIEYVKKIRWRNPPRWPVLGPYVFLYLATIMFYWWPLGLFSRQLWLAYGGLFVVSTIMNISSHRGSEDPNQIT